MSPPKIEGFDSVFEAVSDPSSTARFKLLVELAKGMGAEEAQAAEDAKEIVMLEVRDFDQCCQMVSTNAYSGYIFD